MPHRWELLLLAGYGALAGLLYGVALNFSFWPFASGLASDLSFVAGAPPWENLRRFGLFSLATSIWWDLGRAVTNVVLIAVTGRAVLGTLRRASRRAAFDAEVSFDDGAPGDARPDGEPATRHTLQG